MQLPVLALWHTCTKLTLLLTQLRSFVERQKLSAALEMERDSTLVVNDSRSDVAQFSFLSW
jgi:hypothetical protein